jgi:arsenate reductase
MLKSAKKRDLMDKKVLILCTGNSCRSIMAEALINDRLKGVKAYSSGVRSSGVVNPLAKKLLQEKGIWRDEYHSKELSKVLDREYDLVVTVCDNAKESCPIFPKDTKVIHIGFEDPDGKSYDKFIEVFEDIEDRLLKGVKEELGFGVKRELFKTSKGVKISFSGVVRKEEIVKMVENCSTGKCDCMSDDTKRKIKDMQVSGEDGDVNLDLSGEVSKKEIEEALKRSKVINR